MGTVQSSLQSTGWGRDRGQHERRHSRRRRSRQVRRSGAGRRDIEAHGDDFTDEDTEEYFDSFDDDDDDDTLNRNGDEDDNSFLEGDDDTSPGSNVYDNHPLYFGPAFRPVIEQSPAQLQHQRQIEQQLEQQQQYRHQQQQNQNSQPTLGNQQLSDFILPSAISGLGGVNVGSGAQSGGVGGSGYMSTTDSVQDQLYWNTHLYNLLSGLNVNALQTEAQRAGTLDLSVLEQELDDVEGGWVDIDDEEDEQGGRGDDADIDYGNQGIVREMQPTMRSPTALACGVNLKKSTLRLVKHVSSSNDPAIPASSYLRPNYRLDFTFDSLTPCDVKLFWVVKEVEENGELGFRLRRLHHLPQPTTYHFPSGMNQRFTSPILPLYTMSLPELTMQGLPSTSIRMIQKRNQKMWQEAQSLDEAGGDDAMTTGERARKSKGDKIGAKAGKIGVESKYGVKYPNLEDDFKPIMEDQYFSLVIVIEATKEYKATGPVRSLPTPAADSPGLYLVENQAISTFACFNINSEGGFEIKVMKQKVWINSTNYLIQEIFGFTDSVASAPAKANETAATKAAQSTQQGPSNDKHLSRSLSRMSRAESIASRVDELTKARPKRKKKSQKYKSEGDVNPNAEPSNGEVAQVRRSSKEGTVAEPDATEAGPEAWRSSVASTSAASQTTQTDSAEARTTANIDEEQNGDRKPRTNDEQGQDEEMEDGEDREDEDGEDEDEEEEEEEPNLVLLDAPECVICLSDVKDTIVLPCRHFCICSECGDVLRRRAPQRCPICRQVFQALLHIASTSTHKPDFAMVHSPALRPLTDDVIHGQNTQYIRA